MTHGRATDTHIHFYGEQWPIAQTATLRPPEATLDSYRSVQEQLGVSRCVVVQPTTYGLDNRCQLEALAVLGDDARGVMVVNADTSASELHRLTALGVVGARFHMLPGGAVDWDDLETVAQRIAPLGWHIQLQLDGRTLPVHLEQLLALPCPLVIDHVGRFMPPVPSNHAAFGALLQLLEAGDCWVKLSAPYESNAASAPGYADVTALVDHLVSGHSHRLLWASNWPHPGQVDPPDTDALVRLRDRWLPTPELLAQVLISNPEAVYAF